MGRDFPDRWAVFRASALGDVTLTTGVLDWWHRTQGLRFTFITRSALAPLLAGHPAVDEVISVALDEIDGHDWWRKARRIAADCSGMGYIDLHRSLRSMALNLHWEGQTRDYPKFGLTRRLYRRFPVGFLERRLSALNVPQRYALALDATPPPVEEVRPVIRLFEAEMLGARAHLSHIGLSRPFVALHPFATHPDKAWPKGYFLSLIHHIESHALDDPRNLTGRTALRETCALLAQAQALVTADSGPMHLATAVGTPVVALFGPTSKVWGFHPSGQFDTVMEQQLSCRPCSLHGSTTCSRGRECLTSIEPEEVAARLFQTLERSAGSKPLAP
ncbi:MAG: glycosyltransferase family 9 protein [Humidesulfovibrio sp.]|nr:glycosyltransferase family 9 protein [Humidesulfovibrio sp.]